MYQICSKHLQVRTVPGLPKSLAIIELHFIKVWKVGFLSKAMRKGARFHLSIEVYKSAGDEKVNGAPKLGLNSLIENMFTKWTS